MKKYKHYIFLSDLLQYPNNAFPERVNNIQYYLNEYYPDAAIELQDFTAFVSQVSLIEIEELFTRSFDVQAITTLDLGYILFGDDYKRGELLVNLNREHRAIGNNCGKELADHLPNVLHLISSMKNDEILAELIQKIVAPGIRKMIQEFQPETINMKKKIYQKHHKTLIEESKLYATLYQQPLKAIYKVLQKDFEFTPINEIEKKSDFLNSVNTEIEIDK